jgi:pimeloyl-ACP methyl ester carboxylesterase
MYDFVSRQLGFSHENIVVYGRSIGSGAASHIAAAHREVRSLILQSPIASVRKIAADKVGPVANLIMIENFYDNE